MKEQRSRFRVKSLIILILTLTIIAGCKTASKEEVKSSEYQKVKHVEWSKNLSIYEANIRQHTPEGTFNAFAEHLPRLKELGTDIVWLMPIYPIGEKFRKATQTVLTEEIENPEERAKYLGSYYSIKDYMSVNPEFGTMDDFRNLVNKAHELGMYIILDIAVNHTAWDHQWITEHPEYYTRIEEGTTPWKEEWMEAHPEYYSFLEKNRFTYPMDEGETDWWDTADLNYENEDVRNEFYKILRYWVSEFNVDGYRCDVAAMVPTDFWNEARKQLDEIKPVFMLAEADKEELHEYAFDMTYGWPMHHVWNQIAQGKESMNYLVSEYEKEKSRYGSNDYRMNFITNHDENSWNGTIAERLGDAAKTFAVMSVTTPGMPLIYSGQEACLDKRLKFFEKDSINWEKNCCMNDLYRTLLKLKKENPALWNGDFGGTLERINTTADDKIYAFARTKDEHQVITILNLSNEDIDFELLQTNNNQNLTELFTEEALENNYKFKAWDYKVYRTK